MLRGGMVLWVCALALALACGKDKRHDAPRGAGVPAPLRVVQFLENTESNKSARGALAFDSWRIDSQWVAQVEAELTTFGIDPSKPIPRDHLCFVGADCTPQTPAPDLDDKVLEPGVIRTSLRLAQLGACGITGRCKALVIRNESLQGPEYRGRVIRYPWAFFERQATALGHRPDGGDFTNFLIAVLAHEYGHFLDQTARTERPPSLAFAAANQFEVSARWAAELWADFTAGCVLAALDLDLDLVARAVGATAACSHPPASMRKRAMGLGFAACSPPGVAMPDALAAYFDEKGI